MRINIILILLIFLILFGCEKEKSKNDEIVEKYYTEKNLDSQFVYDKKENILTKYKQINEDIYLGSFYKNDTLIAKGDFLLWNDLFLFKNYYEYYFKNSEKIKIKNYFTSNPLDKNRITGSYLNDNNGKIIQDSSHTFIVDQKNQNLNIELYSCCAKEKNLVILRKDGGKNFYISDTINRWTIDLSEYPNYDYLYGYVDITKNQRQLERQTGVNNFKSEFTWTIQKDSVN